MTTTTAQPNQNQVDEVKVQQSLAEWWVETKKWADAHADHDVRNAKFGERCDALLRRLPVSITMNGIELVAKFVWDSIMNIFKGGRSAWRQAYNIFVTCAHHFGWETLEFKPLK